MLSFNCTLKYKEVIKMPDRSINLLKNRQGELERVEKTVGDKVLTFGFSEEKNSAVHIGTSSFKVRLNSSSDTWVPRDQFIAACRQATAIFKKEKSQNDKLQPAKPQLTFSFLN